MSRVTTLAMTLVALLAFTGGAADRAQGESKKAAVLLTFRSMFGVDGAFVGDASPLGGFEGDEFAWEIERVVGRLDTEGNLFLAVKGLVFKDDPSVPQELRGINDEEEFRGAVACLTEENGQVVQRTVTTQGFPATRSGNSRIVAHVALPVPCVAPVVLVLSGSEDAWFAATGFEEEEED